MKYVVSEEEKVVLLDEMRKHMELDAYCLNNQTYRVRNIYYDTPTNEMVSLSVAKPPFKQKVRARKYDGQEDVYLEIKTKSDGVVGKRRLALSQEELDNFIQNKTKPIRSSYIDNQVLDELSYLFSNYNLKPKTYISYLRLGLFDKNDREFRITFDNQIHARTTSFDWEDDSYESDLLEEGQYIMEIKTVKNLPLWLVRLLSKLEVFPCSFSKVGANYLNKLLEAQQ